MRLKTRIERLDACRGLPSVDEDQKDRVTQGTAKAGVVALVRETGTINDIVVEVLDAMVVVCQSWEDGSTGNFERTSFSRERDGR